MNSIRSLLVFGLVVSLSGCNSCKQESNTQANGTPTPVATPTRHAGRMLVLGFDGVDPRWLERWAAEGKLPNIKRLMEANSGNGYRHLGSTNPPQSPVAWTSFATGTRPGGHGIYDFIARRLNTQPGLPPATPQVATSTFTVQEAGPPIARNLRTGEPFWQYLGNHGVRVVALNVPYSFPPDPMRDGRMLSGLGVPDIRETNSTFTYAGTEVTDGPNPGGGALVPIVVSDGVGRFQLEGPTVPGSAGTRMSVPVEVRSNSSQALDITIDGHEMNLRLREFSPWVHVNFSHEGTTISGILQVIALESQPRMRVFFTPISFDPRHQYSPIAYPQHFAVDIADDLQSDYKTVGWDHDTSALNAEVIDEELFLRDMNTIETQRTQMLVSRMQEADWDLLLWVSTATDRAAHMFYRLIDPEHPRYDAALAARYGNAIEEQYRRMDATVGRVMSMLQPDDTLVILSDHGFHNYRRGLHINQWLRQQGLLFLRNDAESSGREFLLDIDWSRTKAYALGTGQIYLNVRGREREGTVNASDVPALCQQIRTGLLALRDTERGNAQVISQVYIGREVFQGARASDAPDLQVAFAENYRTSWESILGGVPAGLFADNDKKWSGDHASSDVTETPGILIVNRAVTNPHPEIIDLAPTITHFFGETTPSSYEGHTLF